MNTAMVIIRNILNIRVENIFELRNVDVIQIIINKKCPSDFSDSDHLNASGAKKVAICFSEYIDTEK